MGDVIVRALSHNKEARIYAVTTTDALNEVGDRLNYFPSPLDVLGRVMSITAMMGATLKVDETVTVTVDGNGPVGKVIADADAFGHIRGYVTNPHCHFENNNGTLNSKATIGDQGTIKVIKDLHLKEPFVGLTPILTGGIAEDMAYYFSVSEQIPAAISLGVLVDTDSRAVASGGFMVQLLPFASEETISEIEKNVKALPNMSELLSTGTTPSELIKLIDKDAEILDELPVTFRCTCSKERFARGILSLGSKEIKSLIDEVGHAETTCHFCGKVYDFSKEELENLYNEAKENGK